MTLKRAIQLLEIEHECLLRECDRNCNTCNLVQDKDELDEMYMEILKRLYKLKEG